MPATEMIVMVAAFSALALGFVQLLRLVGTAITHRTIRRAIDRDPASAEPLLERLATPGESRGDDRLGLILLAIGIATLGASFTAGDTGGWTDYGIGAAMFPLIVGAALMLRHYLVERAKRRGGAE
jgi:hypothetical protein